MLSFFKSIKVKDNTYNNKDNKRVFTQITYR